jgi:hypothetical protein
MSDDKIPEKVKRWRDYQARSNNMNALLAWVSGGARDSDDQEAIEWEKENEKTKVVAT